MSKSKQLTKLPTLDDCLAGFRQEAGHFNGLAKKATYRAIAIGLWALKAQEIHRTAPGANQGREGGKFTDRATVSQSAADSFDAWLQSATEGCLSRRTAYNYLNAALNSGLTAQSTIEDVAEMEKRDALGERKLTAHDLYAPPRLNDGAPAPSPRLQSPNVKAQQEWFSFYEQLNFFATDEKEADLLHHIPVTTVDPAKEVSLTDLEHKLEHTLHLVREIKAQKVANERTTRRGRGQVIEAETTDSTADEDAA